MRRVSVALGPVRLRRDRDRSVGMHQIVRMLPLLFGRPCARPAAMRLRKGNQMVDVQCGRVWDLPVRERIAPQPFRHPAAGRIEPGRRPALRHQDLLTRVEAVTVVNDRVRMQAPLVRHRRRSGHQEDPDRVSLHQARYDVRAVAGLSSARSRSGRCGNRGPVEDGPSASEVLSRRDRAQAAPDSRIDNRKSGSSRDPDPPGPMCPSSPAEPPRQPPCDESWAMPGASHA